MTRQDTVDPCICPLCGAPNGCAMASPGVAQDAKPCWCVLEKFSAHVLAQVPPAARGKSCICQTCVKASQAVA